MCQMMCAHKESRVTGMLLCMWVKSVYIQLDCIYNVEDTGEHMRVSERIYRYAGVSRSSHKRESCGSPDRHWRARIAPRDQVRKLN